MLVSCVLSSTFQIPAYSLLAVIAGYQAASVKEAQVNLLLEIACGLHNFSELLFARRQGDPCLPLLLFAEQAALRLLSLQSRHRRQEAW